MTSTPVLLAVSIAGPLLCLVGLRVAWLEYRATFETREPPARVPVHHTAAVRHFLDGTDTAMFADSLVRMAHTLPECERPAVMDTARRMLDDAEASLNRAQALLAEDCS